MVDEGTGYKDSTSMIKKWYGGNNMHSIWEVKKNQKPVKVVQQDNSGENE